MEEAMNVRAFFRLFQAQSTYTAYQSPGTSAGVSSATGPYRQWSDGVTDGQKAPLLGISGDGSEYVTVPCFAAQRVTNTSVMTNMTTQHDGPNVKNITPDPGNTVYTYFGCWLDTNQSEQLFPFQPGANPDGPFTGQTLNTLGQVISRGGHQCLVVEIVDDGAPIINNATPATSDKIAQRNIAFTIVANPGVVNSRLATHTFDIRPSLTALNAEQLPDELMIDWRNVPDGSVASIYLPAASAEEILAMAAEMYVTHSLSTADPHTIQCRTGGTTYIPIPKGSGQNFAGLFSVELPFGITKGQEFKIVVRQITGSTSKKRSGKRHVYGAFQISIPVSVKADMLIPEERMLSVMRWIQETIPASSRWYPVFIRYIEHLAGRVDGLGGVSASIPPTQTGIWPGLLKQINWKDDGHHEGKDDDRLEFTGKVDGILYDHFGDFTGFIIETRHGEKRKFLSHERKVHNLTEVAWLQRNMVTIFVHHEHPERPLEILVHGEPPAEI